MCKIKIFGFVVKFHSVNFASWDYLFELEGPRDSTGLCVDVISGVMILYESRIIMCSLSQFNLP